MTKRWWWDDCEMTVISIIDDYFVAGLLKRINYLHICKRANCRLVNQWAGDFWEYRGPPELNILWYGYEMTVWLDWDEYIFAIYDI